MSAREQRVSDAYKFIEGANFDSFAAQCELVKYLQDEYKLTRNEIAIVTGYTKRQVKTRLSSGLLSCVTQGQVPSNEFNSFISNRNGTSTIVDEFVADELNKRENSELGSKARRLFNQSLFVDRLAEAIARQLPTQGAIDRVNDLWAHYREPFKELQDELPQQIAMITQSDSHFFQVSESFNTSIAMQANALFFDRVFDRTSRQRSSYRIETLHMNLLGDNMQGTANYDNQRWDTDRCAIDQAEALTAIYVDNIFRALLHFETIVVNGMPGNHGKIVSKSTDPDHSNWETVVLRSIRWAFRNEPRVTFNLTDDWYQVIDAMGQKFLLTHGHALHGAGSYENIIGTIRKWQDTLEYFDYVVLGHFHRLAKIPLTRNKTNPKHRFVFVNGCYPTEDSFIEKFGASHTNLQWLFFVGEHGITDAIDIELYGATNGTEAESTSAE